SVVDGDPVAVDLGDAVGAARVKGSGLMLGHLAHLAKHLRRAGLIEADVRIHDANRVEHPRHAEGRGLPGENRLGPRGLYEALRSQVVQLRGSMLAQNADDRDLVQQVTGRKGDAVLDVLDSLEVDS